MQRVLRRVALLVIVPLLVSCASVNTESTPTEQLAEASQTLQCPVVRSDDNTPDQNHWYSPASKNGDDKATNQCNSCLDAVNAKHKSCLVDVFLRSQRCADKSCLDTQGAFNVYRTTGPRLAVQHDLRYQHPEQFPRAQGEGCRFIVWALDPVIGVEDTHRRSITNYWREAYLASQTAVQPPYPRETLGLIIQSALTRGQHQLHIHMGTLPEQYQKALSSLSPTPQRTQRVNINKYDVLVCYIPNRVANEPYLEIDIFAEASKMLPRGEADMPRYGLMSALSADQAGVYLIAALGLDRSELNYRQPYQCKLTISNQIANRSAQAM